MLSLLLSSTGQLDWSASAVTSAKSNVGEQVIGTSPQLWNAIPSNPTSYTVR